MANVTSIWLHQSFTKPNSMKIEVEIHGMKQNLDVALPPNFKRVVLGIAQTAAEHLEMQLSATLLAKNDTGEQNEE